MMMIMTTKKKKKKKKGSGMEWNEWICTILGLILSLHYGVQFEKKLYDMCSWYHIICR